MISILLHFCKKCCRQASKFFSNIFRHLKNSYIVQFYAPKYTIHNARSLDIYCFVIFLLLAHLSEMKSIKYYHAHLFSSLRGQKQRLPPCSDSTNEKNCGSTVLSMGHQKRLPPIWCIICQHFWESLWSKGHQKRLPPWDNTWSPHIIGVIGVNNKYNKTILKSRFFRISSS